MTDPTPTPPMSPSAAEDADPSGIDPAAGAPVEDATSAPQTTGTQAPRAAVRPAAGLTSSGRVRTTRVSAWWVGLIIAAIVLVLLLIFIVQNSHDVTVRYLGLHGQVSLAVALLLAAVAGILLIAIPGSARIVQLRRALRRNASDHTDSRTTTRGRG